MRLHNKCTIPTIALALSLMGGAVGDAQSQPPVAAPILPAPAGLPWVAASLQEPARFLSITSWDRGFAAIGRRLSTAGEPTGRPTVWLSTDGGTWSRSPGDLPGSSAAGEGLLIIDQPDGLLVAGVVDRDTVAVWRSRDGTTWRRVRDRRAFAPAGIPSDYYLHLDGIAHHGRHVLVTGRYDRLGDSESYPRVWISNGSASWSQREATRAGRLGVEQPVSRPDGYAALTRAVPGEAAGCESPWVVVVSADGVRWDRSGGPFCLQPHGLAWSGSQAAQYVLGDDGFGGPFQILRSRGSETWRVAVEEPTIGAPGEALPGSWTEWQATGLLAVGDRVVAVGSVELYAADGSGVSSMWSATSTDGVSWGQSLAWPAMVGARPADYPTPVMAIQEGVVVVGLSRGGAVTAIVPAVTPIPAAPRQSNAP